MAGKFPGISERLSSEKEGLSLLWVIILCANLAMLHSIQFFNQALIYVFVSVKVFCKLIKIYSQLILCKGDYSGYSEWDSSNPLKPEDFLRQKFHLWTVISATAWEVPAYFPDSLPCGFWTCLGSPQNVHINALQSNFTDLSYCSDRILIDTP